MTTEDTVVRPAANTAGTTAVAKVPRLIGFAALGISTGLVALLHVLGASRVDPMRDTVSEYVFVPGGWLLGCGALGLAVAAASALAGFARIGLARSGLMRLAFGVLLTGAVLVGMFPTDSGTVKTIPAYIHQYSAGLLFFGVPAVALLAAAALTRAGARGYARSLRGTVVLVGVGLALFLFAHFGEVPEFIRATAGLAERLLFLGEVALLAQLVALPRRYPT